MITYRTSKIEVLLDGSKVGEIRESLMTTAEYENHGKCFATEIGWRYYPSRSIVQGEWFAELEACKRSLEG